MKLLNKNVLIKRLKANTESEIVLNDSEIKRTSICKIVDHSSECSEFVGGVQRDFTVCVYENSGIVVEGLDDADMVVDEDAILFKTNADGSKTMNGDRFLTVKARSENKSELILNTELSDTIFDVIATPKDSLLKIGDKICCPIGTGVDIIGIDGSINRVFHKIEILFKL
jgi:hypothetical protein